MDRIYIIVNKWLPTGGEIEASEIVTVRSTEKAAMGWLESWQIIAGGELKADGHVLEVPLRGTDYNTYYIEDRDVE